MKTIEATAQTIATPERVWELIADAQQWQEWGAWSKVEVVDGGNQRPGAIRALVSPGFRVRERVTDFRPGELFGYEMLDGMKVSGYRSRITLEPRDDGGTTIRWRSEYERAGALTAFILRMAIRDATKRLAKAASG